MVNFGAKVRWENVKKLSGKEENRGKNGEFRVKIRRMIPCFQSKVPTLIAVDDNIWSFFFGFSCPARYELIAHLCLFCGEKMLENFLAMRYLVDFYFRLSHAP